MSRFTKWERKENGKKGDSNSFQPVQTYRTIQQILTKIDPEEELPIKTATEVTNIVWAFGSCIAVASLSFILEELRKVPSASLPRELPPITTIELASMFCSRMTEELYIWDNFKHRRCAIAFYKHVDIAREDLLRERRHLIIEEDSNTLRKNATIEICARIVQEVYPNSQRYKPGVTGARRPKRTETKKFRRRLDDLLEAVQCGYRWSRLEEKFGIGILVLLDSEKADFKISNDERVFQILLDHILDDANGHYQWLKRISTDISDYLCLGSQDALKLPKLKLEVVPTAEIMACRERSEGLASMCTWATSETHG